jgi:hypothetical protein
MELIVESFDCGCARRPMSAKKQLACYRTSHVRTGDTKGLTAQLPKIRRDMLRTRRLLMVDGQRRLVAFLTEYFDRRINQFCDILIRQVRVSVELAKSHPTWSTKDFEEVVTLQTNEQLWRAALIEAFGAAAQAELVAAYTPIVQSIAARAYERTSLFIAEELAPDASVTILRRAQNLAQDVTSINDTTRRQLTQVLEQALEEKQTVAEAVRTIREKVPDIQASRIPTIARTEIGNAVDEGTKQALSESSTVLEVSVIGCQARETRSPQYRGESTCNISGVPVYDINKLRFHPNHTGCIVPSKFIGED